MLQPKDVKTAESVELDCNAPSARINFAMANHPDKEEFFIFGGEFFNGSKTIVYGDFFNYSCLKNEFKALTNPICPSPRSSSQVLLRIFHIKNTFKFNYIHSWFKYQLMVVNYGYLEANLLLPRNSNFIISKTCGFIV